MNALRAEYRIHHPEKILSPGFVVFRELVEHNLNTMIEIAGDVGRLRPHCKTHKMPELTKLQLAAGITKQKAATFAESEMLADVGVKDIFLAYNLVGPNIARGVNFRTKYPDVRFAVTADDPASITQLGEAMTASGTEIDVLLDVNPGRDRTGRPVGDEAYELYKQLAETPGINPAGFHLYDGHLHDSELKDRQAAVEEYWALISAFKDRLEADGYPVPKIVCGGTPTFQAYAPMTDPVIELSPGTCTFHDVGYDAAYPDLQVFTPAAAVLTRVISRPTENRVTFDVGTKGVASDPPMGQRVYLPELPKGKQVLQNEEHLVIESDDAGKFQPGDWTLAFPRHVCPTSALYKEATVIADGEIVGHWEVVARDRCITI
ncbi:D-TA family PLP-dependent enzyme [Thalassoglobus polymorphus]|uniref:D-threonine aldolase n=1 Tax=Thalassoglobus polymorphus TaxID=2527994 RepID=A0A517QMD9_9PLAN|nr:D-TA family PLP-dependent enzyme [Thalassoglobus polymorphus]QDT32771.1 D-threonine aldolase [Thalassoglobus polymorphus]